ncbi:MAG: AbrB family transcriptional regulator [Pseudomonadota bacterium]
MITDEAPGVKAAGAVRPIARLLLAALIGTAGGAFFNWLTLPAPWLTGAATAVAIAAIAGLKVVIPSWIRNASMVFLGVLMGSSVPPEILTQLPKWPISLAGLLIVVVAMMFAVSFFLERTQGFDPATARLACIPGNMSYVLVLAEESSADTRKVAIVQVMRLAILLACLPFAFELLGFPAEPVNSQLTIWNADFPQLGVLLAISVIGGVIFHLIGFPAGLMCGAMFAAAVCSGSAFIDAKVPGDLMIPAFIVLGAVTGANFVGTDRKFLMETALAGIGAILIGAIIAIAVAIPVAHLMGTDVAKVFLAYAPGGSDTMSILALALGLEPAFVVSHHVIRMFGLGIVVPVWLRFYGGSRAAKI